MEPPRAEPDKLSAATYLDDDISDISDISSNTKVLAERTLSTLAQILLSQLKKQHG